MWLETAWGLYSFVVIQEGFEPPTHGLEGRCSIQLGYWTIWRFSVVCLQSVVTFVVTLGCFEVHKNQTERNNHSNTAIITKKLYNDIIYLSSCFCFVDS